MDGILSIGSVVKKKDFTLIILGTQMLEKEGVLTLGYFAAGYPRGITGTDSIGFIWADEINEVIYEREKELSSGEIFRKGILNLFSRIEGKTVEEAGELLGEKAILAELEKAKNNS